MTDDKLHTEIAAALNADGFAAAGYNEYGSVVRTGHKVEASNRPGVARVSRKISLLYSRSGCPACDNDQQSALAAYAAVLRQAAYGVEERSGMSEPYLLVTPKAGA